MKQWNNPFSWNDFEPSNESKHFNPWMFWVPSRQMYINICMSNVDRSMSSPLGQTIWNGSHMLIWGLHFIHNSEPEKKMTGCFLWGMICICICIYVYVCVYYLCNRGSYKPWKIRKKVHPKFSCSPPGGQSLQVFFFMNRRQPAFPTGVPDSRYHGA